MVQPALHDLVCVIAAPTQVLSAHDGQITVGAQGLFSADVRAVALAELRVGGAGPEHLVTEEHADGARFVAVLRSDATAASTVDPLVRLERHRRLAPSRWDEQVVITSGLDSDIELEVDLAIAGDLAAMELIKDGRGSPMAAARVLGEDRVGWHDDHTRVVVTVPQARIRIDGDQAIASWSVTVPGHGEARLGWHVEVADDAAVVVGAARAGEDRIADPAGGDGVRDRGSDDPDLARWVRRSFEDLHGLRMSLADRPDESFFAAGAPWYFTLFGRDSLWAARLVLPVDQRPAIGTLRVLSHLMGRRDDPTTGEQPGKILHELRRGTYGFGEVRLPPRYYGTVDATSLWCLLLAQLWRTGRAPEVVAELLPTLRAALSWQRTAAGEGFLSYHDPTGHGLSNQGWKDSGDSIRFADGSQARGPVELCEVQGYAHAAAVDGAEVLAAHGDAEAAEDHRAWAARLARRFRDRFWVDRDGRRFPALALDGDGRRVDAVTSNIGHLLGTGLLSTTEEDDVVKVITAPDMDSGLGLRTMSSAEAAYHPLSYHCGSVWPHDTAIVIEAMINSGHGERATGLAAGLVRAARRFEGRLPELWSGEGEPGVPYPAACRPQAWSAAAVVPVLRAMGRLD